MKRLFRIIEISKNEQRVVLIAMFVLIAIAFVEYERTFITRLLKTPLQQ